MITIFEAIVISTLTILVYVVGKAFYETFIKQ